MNKNILLMVDVLSNEKGVEHEIIFKALEAALASATKEHHGDEADIRVEIDRETGEYLSYRRWTVLEDDSEDFEFPERQIKLTYAQKDHPEIQPLEVTLAGSGPRRPSRSSFRKSAKRSGRWWLRRTPVAWANC